MFLTYQGNIYYKWLLEKFFLSASKWITRKMFFDRVKSNFPRITTLKCKMQNKRVTCTQNFFFIIRI